MRPPGTPHSNIDSLIDTYHLDRSGKQAVSEAYDAFRSHHGPFITSIAAQMIPDLRRDADNGNSIVFLGRDGHSFAAAVRALEPQFFADHCKEITLSRVVTEAAIQDLEKNRGSHFPQVESFRSRTKKRVNESDVHGAYRHLTEYFNRAGIPVNQSGSTITFVDSSFKGTIQELVSAAYPKTAFTGRYAFFGASPEDPNPDTKVGYIVHLDAHKTHLGMGIPFDYLPEDPGHTFACQEAISIIEDTLHGPLNSPARVTPHGTPEQTEQRNNPDKLKGFNPEVVPERFRDPVVREAVKSAGLLAVHDSASEVAAMKNRGEDWQSELHRAQTSMTEQSRSWIQQDYAAVAPQLAVVLDSTVRRGNHHDIARLNDALAEMTVGEQRESQMWQLLTHADHTQVKTVADLASQQDEQSRESLKTWIDDLGAEKGSQAAETGLPDLTSPVPDDGTTGVEAPPNRAPDHGQDHDLEQERHNDLGAQEWQPLSREAAYAGQGPAAQATHSEIAANRDALTAAQERLGELRSAYVAAEEQAGKSRLKLWMEGTSRRQAREKLEQVRADLDQTRAEATQRAQEETGPWQRAIQDDLRQAINDDHEAELREQERLLNLDRTELETRPIEERRAQVQDIKAHEVTREETAPTPQEHEESQSETHERDSAQPPHTSREPHRDDPELGL